MTHTPEHVRVEGLAFWPRIAEALRGQQADQYDIAHAMLDLTQVVLDKNHDYGSSVWKSPILAPHVEVRDAQLVRMSDKIERLVNLLAKPALVDDESRAATLRDLGAYCVLLAIYLDRQEQAVSER